MDMMFLYGKFEKKSHTFYRNFTIKKSANRYFGMLKDHNIPRKRLTNSQKKEIDCIWGPKRGYDTHELVYSVTGEFNPFVCSELLFRTKIELTINNQRFKHAWADKNYFDKFFPDVCFPQTIVRNIAGSFYDNNYELIPYTQVKKLIEEHPKYVIKPSIDSGNGKDVSIMTNYDDTEKVLNQYGQDYIIQKVINQYDPISKLNPSSVNVIRITSLFLNGKITPISGALRCGAPGSVSDNYVTSDGRGMFIIGINDDGILKDRAYFSCGETLTCSPNGAQFAGLKIPNYEKIKKLTSEIHSKLAHFGFIGFDIAIDDSGNPIVVEYNLRSPGILYYQYVNGPLFGDRTKEVISTFGF